MNDNTTKTIREALRVSSEMAPTAPDLPTYQQRLIIRRPVVALSAGFAGVMLTLGLGFVIVLQVNDATMTDDVAVNLKSPTDTEIPLRFDTETLGVQLLTDSGAATADLDLTALADNVRTDIDPGYELTGVPAFIGRVGEVQGFIAVFSQEGEPDLTCQIRAMGTQRAGNAMACGPAEESKMGFLFHHPEGAGSAIAVVSTTDTAIELIAVRLPTGEEYWQRTHNGGALLIIPQTVSSPDDLTFTAYSADGDVIGIQGP